MPHFRTKRAPPFDNIYIYIYLYPIRAPGPTKMPHNVFLFPDNKRNMKRSSFIFLYYSVLLLLLLLLSSAFGEEDLTQQFSERLDVCSMNLLDGVNVSSILGVNPINERLAGKTLSVAAMWDPGYVFIEGGVAPARTKVYPDVYCTDCGSQLSGYNFEVFEKMAEIGNFKTNWTIFGDIDDSRGETYEQLALNFTRDFDVSGNWWSDTARRRSIGISCGYYHTDVTRMLTVKKSAGSQGEVDFFLFLVPLNGTVWITLLSFMFCYSMLYILFEREHFGSLKLKWHESVIRSVFLSFECLTGGLVEEPKTKAGMLLQSIFSFCMLGFSSLYTAALTSILIEEANSATAINTLDDLQTAGGQAIMFTGDPLKSRILAQNPWLIATEVPRGEILSTTKIEDLLTKYGSQAVILSAADARTLAQQAANCEVSANAVVLSSGGGFITSYDDCHSDLTHVFDTILLGMENDNVLDDIISKYSEGNCDATASASKIDYTITIMKTAGIFVFASAFVMFAFFAAWFFRKRQIRLNSLKTIERNFD